MNNCPAFCCVSARGLIRDKATDHMVKELTDIYKTPQRLSFLFGSTLSLSNLLSFRHKHTALHTNTGVYISVCACSVCHCRTGGSRSCPPLLQENTVIIISQHPFHRSEVTGCLIGGYWETCPAEPTINQLGAGRFDDKDLTAVKDTLSFRFLQLSSNTH